MTLTRVFLAAPFTQLIQVDSGVVGTGWRAQLGSLYSALENHGYSVFLAHEREAWGVELMTAEQCTPLDHKEMVDADVVCAYIGTPPSHGVHIELGWASAMGKPMLLLVEPEAQYTPLLWGIGQVTRAEFFHLDGRQLSEVAPEVCGRIEKLLGP